MKKGQKNYRTTPTSPDAWFKKGNEVLVSVASLKSTDFLTLSRVRQPYEMCFLSTSCSGEISELQL